MHRVLSKMIYSGPNFVASLLGLYIRKGTEVESAYLNGLLVAKFYTQCAK